MHDLHGRRVVFLNWRDLSHPKAGGAEEYCQRLAEQFASAGAVVDLVTSRVEGAPREEVVRGVRVHRIGGTLGVYPRALVWLLRRRRHVDAIVDCQNGIPFFSPLVAAPRTPVVCVVHHVHQEQFELYFSRPAATVGRLLESRGTRLVYARRPIAVVSPSTRADVRRVLRLRGPLHVVPNGITPPGEQDVDRSATPRLVHVGRLVRHKRVDLVLEALRDAREEVADLRLDIVGDGEDRPRLERLALELGVADAVTFHGRLPQADKDRVVLRAWLTVATSVAEGWGLTVVESAAAGVPAVGLDVPGLRDSIRHGHTGWLVQRPGDLARVVLVALDAVSAPEDAAVWGTRARAWAARFTWDASAARLAGVLSAEAERLATPHAERRHQSDLGTVLTLDMDVVDVEALTAVLRRTDTWTYGATDVEVLMAGVDEVGAHVVVERLGLAPSAVRLRVARPEDLLGGWRHRPREADPDADLLDAMATPA